MFHTVLRSVVHDFEKSSSLLTHDDKIFDQVSDSGFIKLDNRIIIL